MPEIHAIFWDVGGVLLTNAWDHVQRAQALQHFHLEEEEFHDHHEMVVASFERGKITLDEYLDQTVFFRPRPFTREEFREVMFSQSHAFPENLQFAQSLADSGKYLMATINNESREINDYRIEKFGLRKIFRLFISSCYVGLRKPEPEIYRLALDVTKVTPGQCCFIDDRPANLESPAALGMHTIQMRALEQLRADLAKLNVGP